MTMFLLQFGSCDDPYEQAEPIVLDAPDLDRAKLEAAMLYAGASFKSVPPTSFRILHQGETEVYRFPESA